MAYCSAGRPNASQPIGCKHVEAAKALVARDDVGRGVTLRMSDVQPRAARVGEHVEHVVFRLLRIEARLIRDSAREKRCCSSQMALPFRLEDDRRDKVCGVRSCVRQKSGNRMLESRARFSMPVHDHDSSATRNAHKTREFADLLGRDLRSADLSASSGNRRGDGNGSRALKRTHD